MRRKIILYLTWDKVSCATHCITFSETDQHSWWNNQCNFLIDIHETTISSRTLNSLQLTIKLRASWIFDMVVYNLIIFVIFPHEPSLSRYIWICFFQSFFPCSIFEIQFYHLVKISLRIYSNSGFQPCSHESISQSTVCEQRGKVRRNLTGLGGSAHPQSLLWRKQLCFINLGSISFE